MLDAFFSVLFTIHIYVLKSRGSKASQAKPTSSGYNAQTHSQGIMYTILDFSLYANKSNLVNLINNH